MPHEADNVSHASLNGIYVKAQELDRGHNTGLAPAAAPPGAVGDALSHASGRRANGADATTGATARMGDAGSGADAETHASGGGAGADAVSHATDAETHASR